MSGSAPASVPAPVSATSLAERKRAAMRQRIATAAAQLVAGRGLAGATVDRIADAADIGRATFFRNIKCVSSVARLLMIAAVLKAARPVRSPRPDNTIF